MLNGHRFGWTTIAVVVFTVVAVAYLAGSLQWLEYAASDTRARILQREVDSPIVIVEIDAQSLASLRGWPFPRHQHAVLLEELQRANPRLVFFDLDFSSVSDPDEDAQLASALAVWNGAPVVLPTHFQRLTSAESDLLITRPLDAFARHATLGSVTVQPDADGFLRTLRTSWTVNGAELPAVVSVAAPVMPPAQTDVPIDFSISPASFDTVSYSDVLSGQVDPAVFAGKTVFVGVTAAELHDMFTVPVYQSLPGVIIQALATETIRAGIPYVPPKWMTVLALALWSTAFTVLFSRHTWRWNLLCLGASLALIVAASLYAFAKQRIALEIMPFALVMAATFVYVTVKSLDEETLRSLAYAFGLKKRDALIESIVESSADCIVCVDGSGRIQTANPAASRLFGCDVSGLHGAPVARFLPDFANQAALNAERGVTESEALRADGNAFPVELTVSRVRLKEEEIYTAIVRDISDRKAQQRALEHQATHDPLTALPNRAALASHLERVLASASAGKPVALLMLDLCRFKEVNDTLGHNVGDRVLCEVAQRFKWTLGPHGFIARIGGDEFTAVLELEDDVNAVATVSAKLHDCLRTPIDVSGLAIDVGVSIGIALYPLDALDVDTLLKHADVAMYVAKRRGSLYECYDAAHDQHSIRRLTMVSELRGAVGTNAISLHYQPKVSLQSEVVEGVEALMRWEHPRFGGVSPGEFVAAAEATDLIVPLTEWTLREALAQIGRWRAQGLELSVAVNLSTRMLQDTTFPARLRNLFEATDALPESLELEITESAMMMDPARALKVVREIHELGVRIAVDDFGTGFSSLGYLRDLPLHALKLDKSFVLNMRTREDDRVIVESTIQMARALRLHVVAEGVETEWDARFLAAVGCDFAQGFFYSRALTAEDCTAFVRDFNATAASRRAARPAAAAAGNITYRRP
jgi:diguanylate cyclase (GGDEF)-like protein/PAS domain S-box-containing protein